MLILLDDQKLTRGIQLSSIQILASLSKKYIKRFLQGSKLFQGYITINKH